MFLVGIEVSIHAPARGATDDDSYFIPQEVVSIHAPARGATTANIEIITEP